MRTATFFGIQSPAAQWVARQIVYVNSPFSGEILRETHNSLKLPQEISLKRPGESQDSPLSHSLPGTIGSDFRKFCSMKGCLEVALVFSLQTLLQVSRDMRLPTETPLIRGGPLTRPCTCMVPTLRRRHGQGTMAS